MAKVTSQKFAVTLRWLIHGEKAREVYNTFVFSSTEDSMKDNKVSEHFEAYFGPRKNITYSRFKFFTYRNT